MPKVTCSCQECGASFTAYPSAGRRFCSAPCYAAAHSRAMLEQNIGRPTRFRDRTGQTLTCVVCGTAFYAKAHQIAQGRRYCSTACHDMAQRQRIEQPCGYCGKVMSLKPSEVARGKRFCSKRCNALGTTQSWILLDRTYNGVPVKRDPKGYIWVYAPERGYKDLGGWYTEHRIVVEDALGRRLASDEQIHHKGTLYPVDDPRNKSDNRLENLQVLPWLEHLALTQQEKSNKAKRERAELAEYQRLYGPLSTTT